jgi:hypothetical protein
MSGLRNQGIHRAADFPKQHLHAPIITALSLTSAVVYSFTPGFAFRFARIRSFCRTKAGTVTAVVKVGTRTAASITFTAATEVAQTLDALLANVKGSASEAITIELTTDGSGVLANAFVIMTIRPWPLNGELGPGTAS